MNELIKHKVFISYHHANDQFYKDELLRINQRYTIFIDKSVNIGDIDDNLSDESIRVKIRDEYLADSTVTVVLIGLETWGRKHIDWEIYSSMYDGIINKKSGILVVNLPSTNNNIVTAGHGNEEKEIIHTNISNWTSLTRAEYNERYPLMPERIIDNLSTQKAKISVFPWSMVVSNPEKLRTLIEFTNRDRQSAEYDLHGNMRRRNYVPAYTAI